MQKLKEVYDIKKQLVNKDINELGNIIKENSNIETININPDNTMYLESNCGLDSIRNSLETGVKEWLNTPLYCTNMILNVLPLYNNSCIVRI